MSEVVVIARAKARSGHEDAVERALQTNAEASREEAGCVSYAVLRGDEGAFMTVERWRERSDVDRHMTSAHVQLLLQTIVPMLDGPPVIQVMREV
ncbi:MAG TPA: putative quinol monooxygenase [Thermoanaerobaculia bacterium]